MNAKKTVFAGNTNNQYGSDMILREASDFYGQSLRTLDTRSVISGYFTHFRANYNLNNDPISVSYYRGTTAYKTLVTCVAAATLNNKYFVLHSAPANQLYVIWYNVNGGGTAPVVANAKYISVSVLSTDTAEVVSIATKLTIENLYSEYFTVPARNGASIEIATNGMGDVDASFDVNTGFVISGTNGTQELVTELVIDYDGTDPIYNGQVLSGYSFDIYSGKFVKNPEITVDNVTISDSDGDNLNINPDGSLNVNIVTSGQTLVSQFDEITGIVAGITTEIGNYTAVSDVFLQKIEVSGTNIAEYEIAIDGVTADKRRTYFGNSLNSTFDFNNGLEILTGQLIQIFVVHNRPQTGDFNSRIQLLES